MSETAIQAATKAVEGVVNAVAPVIAAAAPVAAPVVEGVQAAEAVANAVEANLPHHTAVNDIAVGLQALAGTPAVQGNAVAAAKVGGLAALFKDFLEFLGIEK